MQVHLRRKKICNHKPEIKNTSALVMQVQIFLQVDLHLQEDLQP